MQIVRLYDEVALMSDLKTNTLELIHATSLMEAIKKLVEAHDIIELNLNVEKLFSKEIQEPQWDIPALTDLSKIRRELIVYHRPDFTPTNLLDRYSTKMMKLFRCIQIRKKLHLLSDDDDV